MKLFICVLMSVHTLRAAGTARLTLVHEDGVMSFIPVRIPGIICNSTTAACHRDTNGPYVFVWFAAFVIHHGVFFFFHYLSNIKFYNSTPLLPLETTKYVKAH